jgi:transposase
LLMRWPASALRRYAAARGDEIIDYMVTRGRRESRGVERREQAWTVTVDSRQPTVCPRCGAQSKSRHSTYWRTLWDLSAPGAPVIVHARLGRWRCRNQQCDRRIFTERVPGLAAPFARRTARLAGIVRLLGHSAGGRPSERLMRRLGMPVSDTTILAGLRKHARAQSESSAVAAVHVAGVDDWAWPKGSNYGTIIVDLERRQVVDVLACQSASKFCTPMTPLRGSILARRNTHHSFPHMFLQHTMEQDRAPPVLPHHAELARSAAH